MIRFIDWFAGIGGFRHGLERANKGSSTENLAKTIKRGCETPAQQEAGNTRRQSLKRLDGNTDRFFTCVGSCEIDKYARRVYARNFGHEPEWADSRAVDPAELPDFDLFCAGFPCQSFSVAGKRLGMSDPRGNLFFEIARICERKRPSYLLLENVPGLLSAEDGLAFETILRKLDEIGYDVQWGCLNSKDYGVPQNRLRLFLVGHLRGVSRFQVFPLREDDNGDCQLEITTKSTIGAIEARGAGEYHVGMQLIEEYNMAIRRLTPLECERLQGFPNGWTEGVSDTQRYKMLGNAVTTTVIEAIGKRLLEELARVPMPMGV